MMKNEQKIPEGWSVKKLGECFSFSVGGDVEKDCFSEVKDAEHPYPIYANALKNEGLYGYSSKYKIKAECVTITGRGDVGKVFYREGYFTPIVRLITAVPCVGINAKFMSYICSKIHFFNESTGVPQLTVPQIKWYKVYIPPLTEQKKIAEILEIWDDGIEKLGKLIEAKKLQKKSLMQKLLTGKHRLKGFSEPWKEVKLGEIFNLKKGHGLSKDDVKNGGDSKCILYGELYTQYSEIIKSVKSSTNVKEGILSQIGDILLPASTTTSGIDLANASTLLDKDVLLGGDIIILRAKHELSYVFFAYLLTHTYKHRIARLAQGITIVHLYGDFLKNMYVCIPMNISEQKAIADILSAADDEINLLNKKLEVLKEQKKGLMQQLLTGQIRVKVN